MRKEETVPTNIALTQASDYLVDFTRIAERIGSSKNWIPHYSQQEILDRLFILMSTVAAGCIGNRLSNPDSQSFFANRYVSTIAAGFAGFFISHLLVIIPLIKKRFEMKQACMELVEPMRTKFKDNQELAGLLGLTIEKILALSFVENGRAQATLTWGRRERLLKVLYSKLHSVDLNKASDVDATKLYFDRILAATDVMREITVGEIKSENNKKMSGCDAVSDTQPCV